MDPECDSKEMGHENDETKVCDGTMSQIMNRGGLKFKAMLKSGEPDERN